MRQVCICASHIMLRLSNLSINSPNDTVLYAKFWFILLDETQTEDISPFRNEQYLTYALL